MRAIIVLLTIVAAVAAVPANPQRIIGGSETTIGAYPGMVALLYSRNLQYYTQSCGGSILNNRSVLSAAHCVVGDFPVYWRMRFGSTYANSGGIVVLVAGMFIHPNYSTWTIDNDITILRAATNIEYSSVIQPSSIAGTNYIVGDNQAVWATGWGATSLGGPLSETLRHVQMWTVNQDVCNQRYNGAITANMLCSGWLDVGGRDQCQGDSGGPLYHSGVIVGVCSWGNGCASAYYPGVNTRVSSYTTWIQETA